MTKSLTLTIVVLQQSTYLALDYPTLPSLAIYPPLRLAADPDPALDTYEHSASTTLAIFSPSCSARSRPEHVAKLYRQRASVHLLTAALAPPTQQRLAIRHVGLVQC